MTLQQPCMAQGDSSSSSGKVSTTSKSEETTTTPALDRKRQQLLENSMAVVDRELYRCLDIALSGPMQRVGKRTRAAVDSDHDSGVEEDWDATGSGTSTTAAKEKNKSAKKRAKREPASSSGKTQALTPAPSTTDGDDGATAAHFACPFYANNPGKYKTVKNCCGPGWPTAHRVKEHIYRRHCLKNTCFRCYESFKSDEDLKHHQRLDEPCKKSNRTIDNDNVITDKQEKQIRTRAKTNHPEEERWRDLYKILFPEAKRIPSSYYEPAAVATPATAVKPENETTRTVNNAPAYSPSSSSSSRSATTTTASSSPSNRGSRRGGGFESIQFRDENELLDFRQRVHRAIRRTVRPWIEKEVDSLLRSVEHVMVQKATDFSKEVVTKIFRTHQFGNEQSKARTQTRRGSRSQTGSQASTPAYQSEEGKPEHDDYIYTQTQTSTGGYYQQGPAQLDQNEAEQGAEIYNSNGSLELNLDDLTADAPFMLDGMIEGGLDLESILKDIEVNGVGTGVDEYSYMGTSATDSAYFTNTATESGLSMGSFGETFSSGWP